MAYIDPVTRSFVLTSSRDLKRSTSATLEELTLRLLTHRGSCFWDLSFGSTLHLLPAEKIGPTTSRDVENRARVALQPMVDARTISALEVRAGRVDRNRVELGLRCKDARGAPITFTTWVPV